MRIVLLAKQGHAHEATFRRFVDLGGERGHEVRWRDKASLTLADLAHAHVVCLKSYVDDEGVWQMIDACGVRALNTRAASSICDNRLFLDTMLRDGGVLTPRCARDAAEVAQLPCPMVCKPNAMSAPRDVRILQQPPEHVDCDRWFYQELIESDGVVHKAYVIGSKTFLLIEQAHAHAAQGDEPVLPPPHSLRSLPPEGAGPPWERPGGGPARSAEQPMSRAMAEAARRVGRITRLEVYGVNFIARSDGIHAIDVNPFPSFRGLPRAADALWDHLERTA